VEWLAIWIVVAIVGAIVASNKGRSGVGWFFLCLLLTPLAILVLLALPTLKTAEPQVVRLVEASSVATKTCPQCAETVKAAAKICRFCRYEFPSEPPSVPEEPQSDGEPFLPVAAHQWAYARPREQVIDAVLRTLAQLGYRASNVDRQRGIINFETGISI
jgi:hypothetical protein